jgi:hypothetical protein
VQEGDGTAAARGRRFDPEGEGQHARSDQEPGRFVT